MKLADFHLSNYHRYDVVLEYPKLNYEARQTWQGDAPVTVTKYRCTECKYEDWITGFDNIVDVMMSINLEL